MLIGKGMEWCSSACVS